MIQPDTTPVNRLTDGDPRGVKIRYKQVRQPNSITMICERAQKSARGLAHSKTLACFFKAVKIESESIRVHPWLAKL